MVGQMSGVIGINLVSKDILSLYRMHHRIRICFHLSLAFEFPARPYRTCHMFTVIRARHHFLYLNLDELRQMGDLAEAMIVTESILPEESEFDGENIVAR